MHEVSAGRHPTIHRILAHQHEAGRSSTEAERLGLGAAILIGDLALTWSDELLHTAGLTSDQLTAVLPLIDAMRTEVMYGQYLDLTATGRPTDDIDRALAITRYKTAKYTVERPLHIGAVVAGGSTTTLDTLSAFGLPLGEAFQLRDDLLDVFGATATTGKSSLDDLREGKHTVLVSYALSHASQAQRRALTSLLGDPHLTESDGTVLRRLLTATGARQAVEDMIQHRRQQVRLALGTATFPQSAIGALRQIADAATQRIS